MSKQTSNSLRILVVDDDEDVRASLEYVLEDRHVVECVGSGEEAVGRVAETGFDVVLLDVAMPGMGGIEALRRIRAFDGGVDVVMVSAIDRAMEAKTSIALGAYDYVTKPFAEEDLLQIIDRLQKKREVGRRLVSLDETAAAAMQCGIVFQSRSMRGVLLKVSKIACADCVVLITGESGTGKELIARMVHMSSPRKAQPFVPVNCSAFAETLLESELFGHEKGSFTGADRRRDGCFVQAQRGTIFLDEIGEISPSVQVKLLRVIQEREIKRVGGAETLKLDVRIVAATNRDLRKEVEEGRFRQDLFYRLNVIPLELPPVRERKGDISLIVGHYLTLFQEKHRRRLKGVSPEVYDVLEAYPWQGNVREIRNFVERLVLLSEPDHEIREQDLPFELLLGQPDETTGEAVLSADLSSAVADFERKYIAKYLRLCEWNQSETARRLGIHRNTLLNKMKTLGMAQDKRASR